MLRWLTECDEGWPEGLGPLGALSECKLRIDDAAEGGFDWLQDNLSGVFDAMAAALEVLGDDAALWGEWQRQWLWSRAAPIAGGTSEIQRNLIAGMRGL